MTAFCLVVASAHASSEDAAAPQDDPSRFAIATRIDHIGRILVPVLINDQGPFRFIVDTGASRSTVAPALVQKLNLALAGETTIEVNGITGTARVPVVPVASLRCGDLTIAADSLPVLWAPLMSGADGILGVAGLTTQVLSVDFEHNKVALSNSTNFTRPLGYTRIRARRVNWWIVGHPRARRTSQCSRRY